MDTLHTLAAALSLGTLAGVNLYLTVLITGLAVHFHWITLPPALQGLEVLAHPSILWMAGLFYAIEFFADKIPWIDSAWDALHTVIRPIGAAGLAVAAMGDAHPLFEVAAALVAGGMAFSSHAAKAGTRLAANTSPEPFTNSTLSLAEDAFVITGLGLLSWNPILTLVLASTLCLTILIFLPRLLRNIFQGVRTKIRNIHSRFF